jgi:A/G-specific adenine glycosylase
MLPLTHSRIVAFRRKILRFYELHGRKLPFRRTTDPYRITVAEIMLQQTQVERVLPKYRNWIRLWPDWRSLANATDRQLLTAWSGLGYNRRCLFLGKLARTVVNQFDGNLPDDPDILASLPGLGPYTSKAILIFAFNQPLATIDTNIRRVLLYEFDLPVTTSRGTLEELAIALLPRRRSRDWHNALMDYSVLALPKRPHNLLPVSRQSKFKGSLRQIRGEIVRQLTIRKTISLNSVAQLLDRTREDVNAAAMALEKDGIVHLKNGTIRLAESAGR